MEDYKKKYEELFERISNLVRDYDFVSGLIDVREELESILNESQESEDERIRNHLLKHFRNKIKEEWNGMPIKNIIAWLEKQGGKKPLGKPVIEVWKDMRLEVYQQASGNRHEPNYSDDSTKMFSLTDIDEIFEKVAEKQGEQKPAWSEEDEQMLQKIIQYVISLSEECEVDLNDKINWLKSLKERMKGE